MPKGFWRLGSKRRQTSRRPSPSRPRRLGADQPKELVNTSLPSVPDPLSIPPKAATEAAEPTGSRSLIIINLRTKHSEQLANLAGFGCARQLRQRVQPIRLRHVLAWTIAPRTFVNRGSFSSSAVLNARSDGSSRRGCPPRSAGRWSSPETTTALSCRKVSSSV